jgi:hypothetical protein
MLGIPVILPFFRRHYQIAFFEFTTFCPSLAKAKSGEPLAQSRCYTTWVLPLGIVCSLLSKVLCSRSLLYSLLANPYQACHAPRANSPKDRLPKIESFSLPSLGDNLNQMKRLRPQTISIQFITHPRQIRSLLLLYSNSSLKDSDRV